MTPGDPFHIKADPALLSHLEPFLDGDGCLNFSLFMDCFLQAIESILDDLFATKGNPPRLRRIATNREYYDHSHKCPKCSRDMQCDACTVAVSRTKIGACLQFSWSNAAYCSVDIVPNFAIRPMNAMQLAHMVNRGMLAMRPQTWCRHLRNYVETDMVMHDVSYNYQKMVTSVVLKEVARNKSRGLG